MFVEVPSTTGGFISLISKTKVDRITFTKASVVQKCRKAIREGRFTLPTCAAMIVVRARGFSNERGRLLQRVFVRWIGFSQKRIGWVSLYAFPVFYRQGAWLKVICPATLNPYRLLFYIAVAELLAAKVVKRKRLSSTEFVSLMLSKVSLEEWLKKRARAILTPRLYTNFRKRLIIDIPKVADVLFEERKLKEKYA